MRTTVTKTKYDDPKEGKLRYRLHLLKFVDDKPTELRMYGFPTPEERDAKEASL